MKLIYEGKTKNVYELSDGNYLLKFKDDATGKDGVFDPGANKVTLSIEGMGRASLRLTDYFFRKIEEAGIPTHFISSNIEEAAMTVKPAVPFGKGIEVICRFRAVGSFLRRYGLYAIEGQELDALVEVTLKDDDREDPLITQDALEILGILKSGEFETLKELTRRISILIKDQFAAKNAELYDIKLEFGRLADGTIVLMDEISGGSMRVYSDGRVIKPLDIIKLIPC
jgi:phosphoribosylaminoimidazole-succinocarboxamide synthase